MYANTPKERILMARAFVLGASYDEIVSFMPKTTKTTVERLVRGQTLTRPKHRNGGFRCKLSWHLAERRVFLRCVHPDGAVHQEEISADIYWEVNSKQKEKVSLRLAR